MGATVGAILGSLLERNDFLDVTSWTNSLTAFELVALIITFGVLAHFHCAARLLGRAAIQRRCLYGCGAVLLLVLILYPRHLGIGPDGTITFLPYEYNALMAAVLVFWVVALRLLTYIKMKLGTE